MMTRATEKARTLDRVQWAFIAATGACAVLYLVFDAWWWYLAMVSRRGRLSWRFFSSGLCERG